MAGLVPAIRGQQFDPAEFTAAVEAQRQSITATTKVLGIQTVQ
jgi:hypothetical protein